MGDALAQFEVVEEAPRMPVSPSSPGSSNGCSTEDLGVVMVNMAADEEDRL